MCRLLSEWLLSTLVVSAALEVPTLVNPPNQAEDVPLNGFSIVLLFPEAVQSGEGEITVESLNSNLAVNLQCSETRVWSAYAAVPVLNELPPEDSHSILAPRSCFRDAAGNEMVQIFQGVSFSTIARGGTPQAYDIIPPLLVPPSVSTALMPHTPLNGAWVNVDEDFVLQFTEAVQAGPAAFHLFVSVPRLPDQEMVINASGPQVIIDPQVPGRVTVVPPPGALWPSSARQLAWEPAALLDSAGNALEPSISPDVYGTQEYRVFVSTVLTSITMQDAGTTTAAPYTNLALHFADPVQPSGGSILFCRRSVSFSVCDDSTADIVVLVLQSHFVGRSVVVNPPSDLTAGQWVVSLRSAEILYFNAATASSASFSVLSTTDTAGPEVLAKVVDCNDNGIMDTCENFGAGSMLFIDGVTEVNASTPVPLTASFQIFFSEPVAIQGAAVLESSESTDGAVSVPMEVGTFSRDCVVTIRPQLLTGRAYVLRLDAGVVTDTSPANNPNAGTNFTFFTPLGTPVRHPSDGSRDAPWKALIRFVFPDQTTLQAEPGQQLEILDLQSSTKRQISMEDTNQVLPRGSELLLIPDPALPRGGAFQVVLPPRSLRLLAEQVNLSFSFMPEDISLPEVVYVHPAAGTLFSTLDQVDPYVLFSKEVVPTNNPRVRLLTNGVEAATLEDCSTASLSTTPCMKLEAGSRRATLLPGGSGSRGQTLASWATPGIQYMVDLQQSTFAAAAQWPQEVLPSRAFQLSFTVQLDASGPVLLELSPAQPRSTDSETEALLRFNEPVAAGAGVAEVTIRALPSTGTRPPRIAEIDARGGAASSNVVLTFDSAVQAGSGSLGVYEGSSLLWQADLPADARIVGPTVSMNASVPLVAGTQYTLQEVTAGALQSAFPLANGGTITALVDPTPFTPAAATSALNYSWSNLDEYACLPASGVMPDVQVYFNDIVQALTIAPSVHATLHRCAPADCPGSTALWSLGPGQLGLTVGSPQLHGITLAGSSLPSSEAGSASQPLVGGETYELRLPAGLVQAQGASGSDSLSPEVSLFFSVCAPRFDTPPTDLVRVYAGLPFSVSTAAGGGPRRFVLEAPQTFVQDQLGNVPTAPFQEVFLHDAGSPYLDSAGTTPGEQSTASAGTNVILSFSEVVQAGTGNFELWAVGDASGPRVTIDVESLQLRLHGDDTNDPYSLIVGRQVCLSPSAALAAGSYYVKSSGLGVLRDTVGNPLNQLDTSAALVEDPTGHAASIPYQFTVGSAGIGPPEVAFAAGYSVTGGTTLTGYVLFTTSVQLNTGELSFEECGADYNCDNGFDNPLPFAGADMTFGSKGGNLEAGMLRFVKVIPLANRKYRVTVPPSFVVNTDAGATSPGPSRKFSFLVDVGEVPPLATDNVAPTVRSISPVNGSTLVAKDTSIKIYFSEDVQAASGTIRLCGTASVTTSGGALACASGAELLAADVTQLSIEWRVLTIDLPGTVMAGQEVHLLIPDGAIVDVSTSQNPLAAIQGAQYMFRIADEDVEPPLLLYSSKPTLPGDELYLLFSEAILIDAGVSLEDANGQTPANMTQIVRDSEITIQATWVLGTTYRLSIPPDALRDMAGNGLVGPNSVVIEFSITADTVPPEYNLTLSGIVRPNDAFLITFNEAMMTNPNSQVYIASRPTTCTGQTSQCDEWTVGMSLQAGALPIVSFIDRNYTTRMYATSVQPPSAMRQGMNYSIQVPDLAVTDLAGNSFLCLTQLGTLNFEATLVQDWEAFPPRVALVDAGEIPDPSFFRDEIVIYFTEAVQQGTEFASLEPSTGGENCAGADAPGACPLHYSCAQLCDYIPAVKSLLLSTMTINGSRVTFPTPVLDGGFSALEAGKGYKVVVPAGAFLDMGGNPNVAFDGEQELGSVFSVLRNYDLEGPTQMDVWPPNRATAVAPTTNLRIIFNENVQAGTGLIHVGPLSLKSSECKFLEKNVTCHLPGVLEAATTYSVFYAGETILDSAGNAVASPPTEQGAQWTFRTADIDLTRPQLVRTEAGSGGSSDTESSSVLVLTFSETVQAGEGLLAVMSCQDATCPWSDESIVQTVNVQAASAASELYYSGSSVIYVPPTFLDRDQTYAVRTNSTGVFVDTAGLPVPPLESGGVVYVVPEDLQPPSLAITEPQPNSGNNAPTTDIILYFSEPVTPIQDGSRIYVSDGQTSIAFKADNSEEYIGQVQVSGVVVVLNPAASMDYDARVNVTVPDGAFVDRSGNLLGWTEFNFTTTVPGLQGILANGQATGYGPRMQMVFHQIGEVFVMYGGRTAMGGDCLSDLYTSVEGTTWTQVTPGTVHPASASGLAGAASAVDAAGCLWVIGGQCSSSLSGTNSMWRSCSSVLPGFEWELLDPPEVVPNYDQPAGEWPTTLRDHAMVVLGSWQLVLVDGPRGIVWRAVDERFSKVLQATSAPPFGRRAGPALMASLDGSIFLMGGRPCAQDVPAPDCSLSGALSDVWQSRDAGGSWSALVAQSLPTSGGLQRGFPDAVLILSGNLIVLDGVGTGEILTSRSVPPTLTLDPVPLLLSPAAEEVNVPTRTLVRITFNEAVYLPAGTTSVADIVEKSTSRRIPADVVAEGSSLVLTPREQLAAGLQYRVEAPNLVILDEAGIPTSSLFSTQTYQFTTTFDTVNPQVQSVYPPANVAVEPWSAVVLQVSEDVRIGSGVLGLTCASGLNFSFDVTEAVILGSTAFFEPNALFSGGQTYTVSIPAGLLVDLVGNPLDASTFTFSVISGQSSSSPDGYSGSSLGLTLRPAANVTEPPSSNFIGSGVPQLRWSQPPAGATDVPRRGMNFVLRFDRQVYLSMQHHISILNDADQELLRVDWGLIYLVEEGLWLQLADVLESITSIGTLYKVSIPAGALVDALGRAASAVVLPFTTLANLTDDRPPTLVLVDPPAGTYGVLGGDRNISLWFSEPVENANGTVDIASDVGIRLSVLVNSSATRIQGRLMLVSVPAAALEPAGVSLYLRVSEGAVQDLSRGTGGGGNPFGGLDSIAQVFSARAQDTTSPNLVAIYPPSEGTPEFRHPFTVTIRLLFDEDVHPNVGGEGVGVLELVPTYTSHTIRLSASSAEVAIQGNTVIVSLTRGLMPGEIYTLTVQPGTFADQSGNPSVSSVASVTFSTAPKLGFQTVTPARALLGNRVSNGMLVDKSNRIWIAGGMDASGVAAEPDPTTGQVAYTGTAKDDAWVLALGDDTPCASAALPPVEGSCDTQCSGDPPTLGVETIQVRVWRAPGASGAPCIGSDGRSHSLVGDLVDERQVPCRCPVCSDPPPLPAPQFMENPTLLATFVNVSAAYGTVPLTCIDGYASDNPFTCVVQNRYAGRWLVPQCLPAPCTVPPVLLGNQSAEDVDPRCLPVAVATSPILSGESCLLKCLPGFEASNNVTCMFGAYPGVGDGTNQGVDGTPAPRCVRQACEFPDMEGGWLIDCTTIPPLLGESCIIVCKPGWRFTPSEAGPFAGTRRAGCLANESAVSGADPEFLWAPTCERDSCGTPSLADPNGRWLDTLVTTLGARLRLGCLAGFRASSNSSSHLECVPRNESMNESTVMWRGKVTCFPNSCPPPQDPFGVFSCGGAGVFQDICSLSCADGYNVQFGNGKYTCREDGVFQGMGTCQPTTCSAPDWREVVDAISFDGVCPDTLNHDDTCNVVCKFGYHPRGEFRCSYGTFANKPLCQATGSSFQVIPSINGTLRANLSLASAVIDEANSTEEAWELMASRINATAIEGVLANASNTTADKVSVSFSLVDSKAQMLAQSRRLRELLGRPVRRLTEDDSARDAELSVDWQVRSSEEDYQALLADIQNRDGYFRKQFVRSMEEAVPGIQLQDLTIERVRVVLDYIIAQGRHYELVDSESNAGLIAGILIGIAALAASFGAVALGIRKRRLLNS